MLHFLQVMTKIIFNSATVQKNTIGLMNKPLYLTGNRHTGMMHNLNWQTGWGLSNRGSKKYCDDWQTIIWKYRYARLGSSQFYSKKDVMSKKNSGEQGLDKVKDRLTVPRLVTYTSKRQCYINTDWRHRQTVTKNALKWKEEEYRHSPKWHRY